MKPGHPVSASHLGCWLPGGHAISTVYIDPAALTAGTMTVDASAQAANVWHKFSWTNAMVVALGAATAGDITVCTLPAKTVVKSAYVVIGTAATNLTSLFASLGRCPADYRDYIEPVNLMEIAGRVFGAVAGERGGNLIGCDLPSYSGTTAVKMHFISVGGDLSAALTCTGSVLLQTELLP